jgi:hypothetical protein
MSAADIEPRPPLDWIPEVFRNMNARDDDGVLYRIDWSVPGGRWVEVPEPFTLKPTASTTEAK